MVLCECCCYIYEYFIVNGKHNLGCCTCRWKINIIFLSGHCAFFFGDMDFSRRLYIPLKAELEVSDRSWDAESLRNSTTKATEYGRLKIE